MSTKFELGRPWKAFMFQRTAAQGALRPSFFLCLRSEGSYGHREVIVKTLLVKTLESQERMCREVFGNIVAMEFGLKTPKPCLVDVTENAAMLANEETRRQNRFSNVRPGIAAGCHIVELGSNVIVAPQVSARHPGEALRLFVFDMLAQNADRVERNPNCSETRQGIMVFDFEQCFQIDSRLMKPGPEWLPCQRGLARHHMFYQTLRGQPHTKAAIGAGLVGLSFARLKSHRNALPPAWQPEADRIMSHIQEILHHREEFIADVHETLK